VILALDSGNSISPKHFFKKAFKQLEQVKFHFDMNK